MPLVARTKVQRLCRNAKTRLDQVSQRERRKTGCVDTSDSSCMVVFILFIRTIAGLLLRDDGKVLTLMYEVNI
jgi:hypothetical protein